MAIMPVKWHEEQLKSDMKALEHSKKKLEMFEAKYGIHVKDGRVYVDPNGPRKADNSVLKDHLVLMEECEKVGKACAAYKNQINSAIQENKDGFDKDL